MKQEPFVVVVLEARVVRGAPRVDLGQMGDLVRKVLMRMGFTEHEDYRVVPYDQPVDVTHACADVLAKQSSGPATRRFKKMIQEATSYASPRGHGLIYVGGVSEWPTGGDHGTYLFGGPDVRFVSFCNGTTGFVTCSIEEECLGHELGHAFGMDHDRHGWRGFDPSPDQITAMRRMTRLVPEPDRGFDSPAWSDKALSLVGVADLRTR